MPPSASKQKRLAEKAAKQASKVNNAGDPSVSSSTPSGSTNGGSSLNTPLTSLSAATSQDDLTSMAKLQIATERLISLERFILMQFSQHFF
jgi:ATP-binding cassette, subfamily F, member 2